MDRGAGRATVHRVAKCWTRLEQLRTHTLGKTDGASYRVTLWGAVSLQISVGETVRLQREAGRNSE